MESSTGLSTETVYLRNSANTEDTILAGGSAASPKAPHYGSFCSRHKRSGISYGCHNESPGLLLAAKSDLASLQVIPSVGFTVAAVCIGDLELA